jgi:Tol biopolymer transport system component
MVLPLAGGAARRLCGAEGTPRFAWSPDSQWLLFTQQTGLPGATVVEVWQVPVAGGTPRKLGIQAPTLTTLAMHPDGKRLAYGKMTPPNEEVWILENFLPKPGKK